MISGKLVAALLTTISGYTGYAIPGDPPHIVSLPHDVLAQRVCGRPCQVLGFTLPDGEIVVDEALKIGEDAVATSILVHELTHFLQIKSVAHPQPIDCLVWREREREAFDVQARWLRDNAVSIQVFSVEMARLNLAGARASCVDRTAPPPSEKTTP
jgi:hypothetical protein